MVVFCYIKFLYNEIFGIMDGNLGNVIKNVWDNKVNFVIIEFFIWNRVVLWSWFEKIIGYLIFCLFFNLFCFIVVVWDIKFDFGFEENVYGS